MYHINEFIIGVIFLPMCVIQALAFKESVLKKELSVMSVRVTLDMMAYFVISTSVSLHNQIDI